MILALVLMVAMPMIAERVTPETARKVAATFLSNNGAKAAQLTDLTKDAGFANLYIFNAEQGFVVMAADDCVQPILGYSLTGKFVAENMPTNVSGWLQGYNDEIQYAVDSKMKATAETAKLWKDLISGNRKAGRATAVVNPLLQTTWDQNGIYGPVNGQIQLICELYNNLCPYDNNAGERTVTGCVATAMAQVMKYWGYPSSGIGSHSYTPTAHPEYGVQSADFGATTYDWANMPNALSQNSTPTEINAIATLMYHCGVSVDMNYDISANGGSGAVSAYVPNALITYFNYKSTATFQEKSSYTDDAWIALLKSDLDASKPIQYSGRGTGGHAFVCDGYDSNNNFHFNWGWSGNNDGFYALTSLNPGSGGAGGSNYNFTNNQAAIIGIEPASSLAAPTNLTYTLNGTQDITLSWTGVNAASSYNVFRNNSLIGNTASTSYPETAPFGTNSYYIRAVDSNGQLSLPSNTVTITINYPTPIVNDLAGILSGNDVSLSWTAPEWCYPETPTATLTYGSGEHSGNVGYGNGSNMYWGHRYLAENLNSYNNMVMYKAAFYANEAGAYKIYIYKGTNSNHPQTKVLEQSLNVDATGWFDFDLSSNLIIDGSYDYWIFMYDPSGRNYPATYCSYSGSNANYYTSAPTSWVSTYSNAAFLIKAYVTDGTYSYNLYDNSTIVATDLAATQYTVSNPSNNTAHRYTVKTNYYGGETEASNMVGFALGNASLASLTLDANDMMTVTEGSKLTVSGTISNSDPAHLVLEEGAQLESSAVAGTMYKDIDGYTTVHNDHEGYYLIASPVAGIQPTQVTNMTNGTYDLYAWDPNEQLEWRNYEVQGNFTTLDAGVGYLYANNANTTLAFAGQLNSSFTGIDNLNYVANDDLHSLTLVGNPYAYQAEFSIADTHNGGWVSAPNCLTLNSDGDGFEVKPVTGNEIVLAPMEAVLVQATGNGQSFIEYGDIEPIGDGGEIEVVPGLLNLSISKPHGGVMDNALVRFNGGSMLRKLRLGHNATELYIPQDGKDYAVVCAQAETEIPVNFKASQNGTYTLSIDSQNLDLDYLLLIDNMTGEDVDFLATPSYTFEGNTNDYESRFRLIFAPIHEDANGDNEHFAFYADGEIRLLETCQGASLQVVDMMGRVVLAGDAINRVSTSRLAAGVYVLRLINGEKVKTQKIVVR